MNNLAPLPTRRERYSLSNHLSIGKAMSKTKANSKRRNYSGENNPNWRGGNVRICLDCGEPFTARHYGKQKFCSRKCYGKHRHKTNSTTFECIICGREVKILKHDEGKRKYCSQRCMGLDTEKTRLTQEKRAGWIMSAEARQKISIAVTNRSAENVYSRGKSGHYTSTKAGKVFYRSSYELKAFRLLDDNDDVLSYNVEPFIIVYKDRFGDTRRYRPDILVYWQDGYTALVEVKAAWRLDIPKVLEKLTAGVMHAKSKGWGFEIWTGFTLGVI